MTDPTKTDPYTLEVIKHKLQSSPVSAGMENYNNIIEERIDQGYSRKKALLFGAKSIANYAVAKQNKNYLQYISQIWTANNTNYAQTENGLKIIQEAISTIDRLNNQRDEANSAQRRRQKDLDDEDIKTRFADWSFMEEGEQKNKAFEDLRKHALRMNRSTILRAELFQQKEIRELRRDRNIQYNTWEDKLGIVKKVYKDNSTYYKSNPDRLIGGVLNTFRDQNVHLKPEDTKALEEYVKGWVSIGDTDNYKDIISRVKGEAEGYVKENIAATEGKQGKVSEPSDMDSIIEKHTNLAQEALQEVFETFMEKNKDKDGNYIGYKQWEDDGEFGKNKLEENMRAKLDTLLSSEGDKSLRGELKTAISSVDASPKTKEQKFNDWRDNYNTAKEGKKQHWIDKGLKSGFSDLVEPYLKRRKTADAKLKALPIKYLDIGSKPTELAPIFAELDRLAPLGAGGQRRGIEKFAREKQMQLGQALQDQIKNRIASSKDIRELKVWRDAVSEFNQQILSKFPSWRPAKIELDRLLTPKRGEVGVPDKAVKRISELAGDLEVALVTDYVNFITTKKGFKEFEDWSIKEKGDFNSIIRGKVRDFFTKDILDELTGLSGIRKGDTKKVRAKQRQYIKRAYRAVTGGNLGSTFDAAKKNKYRVELTNLDPTDEDDEEELVDLYNKIENGKPPSDWSSAAIKIHLLNIGNLEFK